jgi:hypothetical protein
VVAVDVGDRETSGSVKVNDPAKFFGDGCGCAVGDRDGSAISNVPRDGVEEAMVSDKKKIHT